MDGEKNLRLFTFISRSMDVFCSFHSVFSKWLSHWHSNVHVKFSSVHSFVHWTRTKLIKSCNSLQFVYIARSEKYHNSDMVLLWLPLLLLWSVAHTGFSHSNYVFRWYSLYTLKMYSQVPWYEIIWTNFAEDSLGLQMMFGSNALLTELKPFKRMYALFTRHAPDMFAVIYQPI